MAYNNLTSRTEADPLIPEEVVNEIFKSAEAESVVMQLARKLPNGSRGQERLPVMSALATASFITGDTGLIPTSEVNWTNKYVYYEGMGVILPIAKRVVRDSSYDIWGESKKSVAEAMGKTFDRAVFHGTNAPDLWPDDLVTGATAAGSTVSLAAATDVFEATLGENGTFGLVEEDGYMVSGNAAAVRMKRKLRGSRDADGQPIFVSRMQDRTMYDLDGTPIAFAMNGGIDPALALMISGDFKQLVYSIRQDAEFEILDQAVIQDASGNIIYNLAQQNMVALKCTFYLGWALPNPPNRVNESTQYPFSVLLP